MVNIGAILKAKIEDIQSKGHLTGRSLADMLALVQFLNLARIA